MAYINFVFFVFVAVATAGGCGGAPSGPNESPRDGGPSDSADARADSSESVDAPPPEGGGPERACGVASEIYDVTRQELLDALAGCTRFLGSLRFGDSLFTSLDGLESLRSVDGTLNLFRNRNLADIDGLRQLETVGGDLLIHFHWERPASLRGLASLRSVGGQLFIRLNESVAGLDGLEQLRSVGALRISENSSLRSLAALSGLETVTGDLSITLNEMLSQAEAEAFAGSVSVGGTVTVSGNRP